jgi:hypothetical protein
MSDPLTAVPPHLTFAYRADELQRLREFAGLSIERTMPWNSFWIVSLGMIFVIGLAVLGAQKSGLLAVPAVPPVLLAAWLTRTAPRSLERSDLRWDIDFSDAGLCWKSDLSETRVSWRAVKSIEAWSGNVLIWLLHGQTLPIPARVFADDAARRSFIAAVQARIDGAAKAE